MGEPMESSPELEPCDDKGLPYEKPSLLVVGNLRDLVAGSGFDCDSELGEGVQGGCS